MMTVDEAMNHAQDQLQCAFEKWLTDECPSGDCESVERLWNESFVHQELIDELQPVMALTWEVRRLREENERLRVQLAGCGVAAMQNTADSRAHRINRDDYGWSASYADVCSAVDREISLREENERLRLENLALKADAERINWLAGVNNTIGGVALPREIVEANLASLRQAIDAARGAK